MWRSVIFVWTDVSEDRIASIFRVEESASEEPAWASSCRLSCQLEWSAIMMAFKNVHKEQGVEMLLAWV
jgi:hypothetical protein